MVVVSSSKQETLHAHRATLPQPVFCLVAHHKGSHQLDKTFPGECSLSDPSRLYRTCKHTDLHASCCVIYACHSPSSLLHCCLVSVTGCCWGS